MDEILWLDNWEKVLLGLLIFMPATLEILANKSKIFLFFKLRFSLIYINFLLAPTMDVVRKYFWKQILEKKESLDLLKICRWNQRFLYWKILVFIPQKFLWKKYGLWKKWKFQNFKKVWKSKDPTLSNFFSGSNILLNTYRHCFQTCFDRIRKIYLK